MATLTKPRIAIRDRLGLSAYYFAYFAIVGFISPFLPLHWRALGFSYLQIGVLLALAQIAGAALLLPIGALSDHRDTRRPIILVGSALIAASYFAYPYARSFGAFALLQTVIGVGMAMSASTAAALGMDVFRRAEAARSFASVRAWGTIGFLIVMGLVYLYPPWTQAPFMFNAAGVLAALSGPFTLLVDRPKSTERHVRFDLHGARHLLTNTNLRAFVVCYFLGYLALMSLSANLSLYLHAFSPTPSHWVYPLAFTISAGIELPFLAIAGWAGDRWGRLTPLRVTFVVLPLRLACYVLAPSPAWALALQATHGLTFSILAIVPFAFVADCTPRRYAATGQALLNATGSAACALGPLVSGLVAQQIGIRPLFLFLACVCATGSLVFFTLVREPDQAT